MNNHERNESHVNLLRVDLEEVKQKSQSFFKMIEKENTVLIPIYRGGLSVAMFLNGWTEIPIGAIYQPSHKRIIPITERPPHGVNIVIVEDVIDTGETIRTEYDTIYTELSKFYDINSIVIYTATMKKTGAHVMNSLHEKVLCNFDIFCPLPIIEDDVWIEFPWEQ